MSVTVAIVDSRAEAELIVGMLQNSGMTAYISADDLGGVDLALQAQGVRVLVSETDGQAARKLLNHPNSVLLPTRSPNAFQRWLITMLGGNK